MPPVEAETLAVKKYKCFHVHTVGITELQYFYAATYEPLKPYFF
jgi:hypothetical protein